MNDVLLIILSSSTQKLSKKLVLNQFLVVMDPANSFSRQVISVKMDSKYVVDSSFSKYS